MDEVANMPKFTYEKPYYTMHRFLKETFGQKVFKVSLNAGFSCPNKDGTKGVGGCIYCSLSGSGDFAGSVKENLQSQFDTIKTMMQKKWSQGKYIAYFQANTNTFADRAVLKTLYDEALGLDPNIVGLAIATRADCLDESIVDLLDTYHQKTYLQVELGLQSIHEKTAEKINRGHDLKTFDAAVRRLRNRGINVVVHIINGFPWESEDAMLKTVQHLNSLDIQGIKIHMLHVVKNTKLANLYHQEPFDLIDRDTYAKVVANQIEHLDPNIVIQRLTGDAKRSDLITPFWTLKKFVVINTIDKLLRERGSYQGIYFKR